MKKWIMGFASVFVLLYALPLWAEDIYRIEVEKNSSNGDLKKRVQRLEQAVDQLQRKVFDLENSKQAAVPTSNFKTCFIKTPFDGTFTGSEPTEAAARASALEKCNHKAKNNIYCEEKELKCEK